MCENKNNKVKILNSFKISESVQFEFSSRNRRTLNKQKKISLIFSAFIEKKKKMIIRKSIQLLFLLVSLSESHDYHQHQQMHEQNVRNNVKTYGGYVPTNTGHNQAANDFINSQNHHSPQPSPYQPYGWNFNQPRRTYGKSFVAKCCGIYP